jgi:hypothetical protein
MRPTLASITVLLSAFPATAQTVDLSKWSVEHINTVSNGTWTVNAPRFHTSFAVSTINDCSVLYSDVLMPAIDFRLSVDPAAGDDDIIGFVLGFNPGDGSNPNADYLVVDWKAITQAYGNWGTARAHRPLVAHGRGPGARARRHLRPDGLGVRHQVPLPGHCHPVECRHLGERAA